MKNEILKNGLILAAIAVGFGFIARLLFGFGWLVGIVEFIALILIAVKFTKAYKFTIPNDMPFGFNEAFKYAFMMFLVALGVDVVIELIIDLIFPSNLLEFAAGMAGADLGFLSSMGTFGSFLIGILTAAIGAAIYALITAAFSKRSAVEMMQNQ